jgi:hypothetical protein
VELCWLHIRWRLAFLDASYDKTAKADTCTPPETIGEYTDDKIDVIKPGPSVRSYLLPMG